MLQDGIESQCGTSGAQLLEPPFHETHGARNLRRISAKFRRFPGMLCSAGCVAPIQGQGGTGNPARRVSRQE
jgi:hypothetical protein